MAAKYGKADLVAGNNVYAHVPDIRDFTAGLAALVKPTGLVTLEFPHLLRLIERNQYDTIYHEHYQYLSLLTASRALAGGGLTVVDVDELSTHGGSRLVASPGPHDQMPGISDSLRPSTPCPNIARGDRVCQPANVEVTLSTRKNSPLPERETEHQIVSRLWAGHFAFAML